MFLERFFIRLRHWEYWPFHLVYGPVYLYWAWLALKARSFFFFNAANPGIKYGGFLMESKRDIYDILPPHSYPATIFLSAGENITDIDKRLEKNSLSFPLIAKPDIGLRGMSVTLIADAMELRDYHHKSKVDYLLQQYIHYTNEIGLFWYRYPGEARGHISGITKKELLTVTGDGEHSIEQLLKQNDRYLLQWNSLQKKYGEALKEILPKGMEKVLVPFGNHCRGAKFIDITSDNNPLLQSTIDRLLMQIPGFYFGRLDIRYDNWDDLGKGINFFIIELNGAGSEPAHIYDPKHSIWFGWKEITRHWDIMYRISKINRSRYKLPYLTRREAGEMFKANKAHIKLIS